MGILEDIKQQYKFGGISQKLIFWNVGLFVFSLIFFYNFQNQFFIYPEWLKLSSAPGNLLYYPWTLLSYSFFHAGFLHLFFNMMVLNFSSRLFLTFFNERQLLGLYLLSSIFAGVVFVVVYFVFPGLSPVVTSVVGASAAIMAILVATATYAPLMSIRLLLIGNVKLWHIAAVIILLDLLQIRAENTGGHIAHLAGAFFGFVFVKLLQQGTDLSSGITRIITFFTVVFHPKKTTPFKKVHKNPVRTTVTPGTGKDIAQKQIDEILDKISQSGYDSLTKQEKEFLFKAGK